MVVMLLRSENKDPFPTWPAILAEFPVQAAVGVSTNFFGPDPQCNKSDKNKNPLTEHGSTFDHCAIVGAPRDL
jgi:hypothetical protein